MDLISKIKASRSIKDNSLKSYITSLKRLNDNKEIENLDFLNDTGKILKKMDDLALTTKKNRLTAIIVALKAFTPAPEGGTSGKDAEESKELKFYRDKLDEFTKEYLEDIQKNQKSEKEKKNWSSLSELKKVMNGYKRDIQERGILKKDKLTSREFYLLQNYLITALYLLLPPLRLDYIMKIITDIKDASPIGGTSGKEDKNYLLNKSRNKKIFIIREFKNVKTHGEQIIEVPKALNTIINNWLKYNKTDAFLLNNRGGAMTSNGLGKAITKAFKPTGKDLNLGMLRKIWVSENTDSEAIKKAENLAAAMLHSPKIQQTVYNKKD